MAKSPYAYLGGQAPVTTVKPPKATVVATTPPPPADPYLPYMKTVLGGIQTPAQIAAMANSQALAGEKARLAAMQAVSDQTIAAFNNQSTRAQGFSEALARLQAGEDQQASARYGQAADRLTGIGTGLTGEVSDLYQGSVDQAKGLLGSLTEGRGVINAPAAADIRNASQYAGVTGPAGSLVAGGVNAARIAQSDAAARVQNLAHIAMNYTGKADEAIAQAASDKRAEIAKRPASIAELVNQLTTNRQAGVSNLMNILNARTTYQQNQRTFEQAEQKRLDDLKQQAFTNWATKQGIKNTRQATEYQGEYLKNAQAGVTGYFTGADGKLHPTFTRQQWDEQTDQTKKNFALQQSNSLGYQIDWQTGLPKLVDGHVVPNANYKVDPNNPNAVVPIFKPTAGKGKVVGMGGLSGAGVQSLVTGATEWARLAKQGSPGGYQLIQPQYDSDGIQTSPAIWKANPGEPATAALNYNDALTQLIAQGPQTRGWAARATTIAKSLYKEGLERPWENPGQQARKLVRLARKNGDPYSEIVKVANKFNVPLPAVTAAVKALYPNVLRKGTARGAFETPGFLTGSSSVPPLLTGAEPTTTAGEKSPQILGNQPSGTPLPLAPGPGWWTKPTTTFPG